jgi:hypothetical protein
MRGPIRTPILLPFGNRNTPAEPHRAVPWAVKPGLRCLSTIVPCLAYQACGAFPGLSRLAEPALPQQTLPSQACRVSPHQTLLTPDLA